MCWRIYTRLLNVPWQALASCVSSGTALLVFIIHSLHTPQAGAYCGALACHEVGPSAFSFFVHGLSGEWNRRAFQISSFFLSFSAVWKHQAQHKQDRLAAFTGSTQKKANITIIAYTGVIILNRFNPLSPSKEREKYGTYNVWYYLDDGGNYSYNIASEHRLLVCV